MITLDNPETTLIDALLEEQRSLTAVERFSRRYENELPSRAAVYRDLLPASPPGPGQQYAFEVNLDQCSGCKACVTACHSLNGLDETEMWRNVGLLGRGQSELPAGDSGCNGVASEESAFQQHVTTACHHCVDPGCLNGCPVLAYDKDPVTGIVRHLDDQCIGCRYCVMKCPYEVPKYSSRLGIVRKCDMCSQRLSVGEAPACVQACPHEAIRITVVRQSEIETQFRGEVDGSGDGACFLPDSPDPTITLPTTRFVSVRLPQNLCAADHEMLRLDHAHWPLVIMLVLTQSAAGIMLAAAFGYAAGTVPVVRPLLFAAFGILSAGLLSSILHLGKPMKSWRAFLGWRTSWLSREIIALNAFCMATLATLASSLVTTSRLAPFLRTEFFLFPAAIVGLIAVFASAMVYVDTKRPFWCGRLVFGNFFGTLLLGPTFAAVVLAGSRAPLVATQSAAVVAGVVRTALFIWRRMELHRASRDPMSPIHFNARIIEELLPWTLRLGNLLFIVSTCASLPALTNSSLVGTSVAAFATFASELVARYVFFTGSASKRMPGGIAA